MYEFVVDVNLDDVVSSVRRSYHTLEIKAKLINGAPSCPLLEIYSLLLAHGK